MNVHPPVSSDRPVPPDTPKISGASWLAPVLIVGVTLAVAALADARPRGDRIAAIFPPWWPADKVLASALAVAPVSGIGRFSFIVAASGRLPDTASRLRTAGAWLIVDGSKFSFCLAAR